MRLFDFFLVLFSEFSPSMTATLCKSASQRLRSTSLSALNCHFRSFVEIVNANCFDLC